MARILRPRGLRGEVAAEILTDFPERLPKLREVWLVGGGKPPRKARVRKCWLSPSRGGQAIFHFADVDGVDAAEALRGLEVQVPLGDRTRLKDGSYYVDQLVGCAVSDPGASEALGVVREVQFMGAAPLLAVEAAGGEILVPLAAEYCPVIDVQNKRIEVRLPEGLRDLNRG